MYKRRPDWVGEAIALDFAEVSKPDSHERYLYNGQGSYDFLGGIALSSTIIRDTAERLGRSIRVLDVGAGAGHVVQQALRDGHEAQGVSAFDYRKTELARDLADTNYLIGDAHGLLELPGVQPQYDVVLSRWTLRHLTDPLSVIEQMADLVSEGGTLAIDFTRRRLVDYRTIKGTQYSAHECAEDLLAVGLQLHPVSEKFVHDSPAGLPFYVPDIIATRGNNGAPVRFHVEYDDFAQAA